ncbi:MAG TPA: Uma2 family endonuclease [Fimbriimonadaceae bacterium]|nr:Uma2 family endonuclease [Fimbriimonadaceae bacterium]
MDLDERLIEENEMMVDFFNGAQILQKLTDWAYVIANQREVLRHISLFEKAYEQLVKLHAIGKLCAGDADFSAENLERIKRIRNLIQPGLDRGEPRFVAQEVHMLAEECLRGLTLIEASPAGRSAARAAPASGEPPRMTIEEWAAMPEDEPGELVGGYLVEEEMADFEHETIVSFLNAALRTWVAPKGGFVAGSEAKLAVGPEQGRKPDLSVYLPGGSTPPRRGPIRVPPDIVIEVEGPTSLDARRDFEKEQDYAAFGIRWCWHIDPASRCLMVRELQSDRRYKTVVSTVHRCGAIPGCADLTIDLDALWDELDRLGPPGS